jgi:hypothetical protein
MLFRDTWEGGTEHQETDMSAPDPCSVCVAVKSG